MSSDTVDVEIPILYVRWRLDPSHGLGPLLSSIFKFHGREWYLEYFIFARTLTLRLMKKSSGSDTPFEVSFNVESNSTGRIIPELTSKKRITDSYIFQILEEDISRLDPEFSRTRGITYLVVLKKVDDRLTDTDINVISRPTVTTLPPKMTLCLESLSEDLAKLMVQDSYLDVEFQCGGECTKAHSAIVSARSPVIASMLASNMIEGRTKIVKIPNVEPEIFHQFLKYLYSGKVDELSCDTAISLYEIGQQYAVHALAKRCSDYLIEHLSVESACEVLFVADAHSDADFVKSVIDFLVKKDVPTSGGCWLEFCDKHPKLASIVLTRYCERLPKCKS